MGRGSSAVGRKEAQSPTGDEKQEAAACYTGETRGPERPRLPKGPVPKIAAPQPPWPSGAPDPPRAEFPLVSVSSGSARGSSAFSFRRDQVPSGVGAAVALYTLPGFWAPVDFPSCRSSNQELSCTQQLPSPPRGAPDPRSPRKRQRGAGEEAESDRRRVAFLEYEQRF